MRVERLPAYASGRFYQQRDRRIHTYGASRTGGGTVKRILHFAGAALLIAGLAVLPGKASSHREAPLISQDPLADNTDLYAFLSPDAPNTVTIVANYIPLEAPAGGPNSPAFDDTVLYEIHVDNNGDAEEEITYQFRFHTETRNPDTFLYNTGPITSLDDTELEPAADLRRDAGHGDRQREHGHASAPTSRRRPTTSARARRRTTRRWPPRPCTRCPEASRCSPASATIRSSWTSARSSISPASGPSTRFT